VLKSKIAPVVAYHKQAAPHVRFDAGYRSDVAALMERVHEVVAYCDTVELFFRGSSFPELGKLRKDLHAAQAGRGKPPRFVPVKANFDGSLAIIGRRFIVNRPSADALLILDKILDEHPRACMSRVDIAFDFVMRTQALAHALMLHLVRHGVMRWNKSNAMPDEKFGTYFANYRTNKPPTRNVLVYWDKPSKVRGKPCCHLEIRFIGAEAVQRMGDKFGIEVPSDLVGLKPRKLFAHNLILAGDFRHLLDDLHQRVPVRIAKRISQDYRANLLGKLKMIKLPRVGLDVLQLPKSLSL
jgi:hypothetical protein